MVQELDWLDFGEEGMEMEGFGLTWIGYVV